MEKALRHADYGYLIETGRIAAGAYAAELRQGDLIERVYLGHGSAPAGLNLAPPGAMT